MEEDRNNNQEEESKGDGGDYNRQNPAPFVYSA